VSLPNPGGRRRQDAFSLRPGGPLGPAYARFLLDRGYKVGRSAGERVNLTGQWGSRGQTAHNDAVPGTEYWYIEAFRFPAGFVFGPNWTILSEWHANSSNQDRPLYRQAPWKLRVSPHNGGLYFNVQLNTGLQFGNGANSWEINGWNRAWGSTEPSANPRSPKTDTRGRPAPDGNPFWLAPVVDDKWRYFIYRVKWTNDWDGIFQCWTRTEDDSEWTQVANYSGFPTHVYQLGDLDTNHYAVGMYYRDEGGVRESVDYGGRARSTSVADADLGVGSTGFQELAALAAFRSGHPAPPESSAPVVQRRVAWVAGTHVPRRGRLAIRVGGVIGAGVQVVVRGPHGHIMASARRRIGRGHHTVYRVRLRRYHGQRTLYVSMTAEWSWQATRAHVRLRLSRHGTRVVDSTTRFLP
jgi:hypothetical protein